VWQQENKWFMVIGAQTTSLDGTVVLFSSDDLKHWQQEGPLAGNGITLPNYFGYMWECPDFFTLNNMDILLVSPQGLKPEPFKYVNLFQSGYFIGKWDLKANTFVHGEFNELDHGFDFYAPQTFEDLTGRRILIAWMGMGDEQEQSHHSIKSGWVHALTLPRELYVKDGCLYQKPVEELKQLRKNAKSKKLTIANEQMEVPLDSELNEIYVEIDQFEGKQFEIQLQNNCKLIFNNEKGILTLERKSFDQVHVETRQCKIDKLQNIHMYLDRSSLEIFINDGQIVFTSRFYKKTEKNECIVTVEGKSKFSLKNWSLHPYQIKNLRF